MTAVTEPVRRPCQDATHLVVSPLEFMQRLAAQVTRLHPATPAALLSPLKGSVKAPNQATSGTAWGRLAPPAILGSGRSIRFCLYGGSLVLPPTDSLGHKLSAAVSSFAAARSRCGRRAAGARRIPMQRGLKVLAASTRRRSRDSCVSMPDHRIPTTC